MDRKLIEYVEIAPRFRRSVNIEADFGRPDTLEGYVVSPLASELARRILQGASTEDGTRAWSIVGPYGTGKSSFLTYVGALLSDGLDGAVELTDRFWPEAAAEFESLAASLGGPLLPVIVTGQQIPAATALVLAASRAADGFWSGRGKNPTIVRHLRDLAEELNDGKLVPDSEIVDALIELNDAVVASSRPGEGLCLFIDEMGKFLEYAASRGAAGDIYLFQLLAEASARSTNSPFVLITTLHQGLDAYAEGLPRAKQLEWSKVSGRFETVPFLETPRYLTKLINGAVVRHEFGDDPPAFAAVREDAKKLCAENDRLAEFDVEDLNGCAPLHPVTSLCLGPLFRSRLGQNERSLFAFLSSREPHGFQAYLSEASADVAAPYDLSKLYDYVVANTGVRIVSGSADRTWAAAQQAISRLPGDAPALDAKLIKHVAVLSQVGVHIGLRADADTLAMAAGHEVADVEQSLKRLTEQSAIVFRQFKQAYHVWDGSDLNIPELIEERRRKVVASGALAAKLQKSFQPYPIVATRHYHQTGTLRHLVPQYVGVPATANEWPVGKTGDGDLLFIMPDRLDELEDAQRLVEQQMQWFGERKRPLVIALPRDPEVLLRRVVDYFAIDDALKNTPELASDPVGRRELTDRLLTASDRLTDALATSFTSASLPLAWYSAGKLIDDERRVSACASAIFDEAYDLAPRIENELINRESISSHAAGARRELMERMFDFAGEPRLGMEGYPAEVSLFRSIFEREGLYVEGIDGSWHFVEPSTESSLHATWAALDGLFGDSPGQRFDFKSLMRELARPPLGVREGVAPILLLAYFITRRERLFLYEDNSFLPAPGADLAARLLKRPSTFELQQSSKFGETSQVVEAVANAVGFDGPPTVLNVVRAIVRLVSRLSMYAERTQNLSTESRQVRNAVRSSRDPVKLLFDDLPQALGFDSQSVRHEAMSEFADALAESLRELQGLDTVLLDQIDAKLQRFFGGAESEAFYELLAHRANALEGKPFVPMRVRNFVAVAATASGSAPGDRETFLQGAGTAILGKPPTIWSDDDVRQFEFRALEASRDFLAAEQLTTNGNGSQIHRSIIRVSVLDDDGNEHHGISTATADDERLTGFRQALGELAEEHGLESRDMAFAVIATMMDMLREESDGRAE